MIFLRKYKEVCFLSIFLVSGVLSSCYLGKLYARDIKKLNFFKEGFYEQNSATLESELKRNDKDSFSEQLVSPEKEVRPYSFYYPYEYEYYYPELAPSGEHKDSFTKCYTKIEDGTVFYFCE